MGINSHETTLGYFTHSNAQIHCVVCKDFRAISHSLLEFKFIKNSVLEENMTINNKDDLDIILRVIQPQHFVPKDELKSRFWDMFVVDAYIGNFDRHSRNWGILVNEIDQICTLAPVYDNGSALFAGLLEDDIQSVLLYENEIKGKFMTI
ncbi:MAG: HipA domain-containing protein [Campylobacter sp.]|nr:HipA domain-containing protein [Campylobacter sp.]